MRPTSVILVLVILIAIVAAIFAENHRAAAHTGRYVVAATAGNGLNLRTGPGGQYRVLMTMARGDVVKARGHRGNWMYLTHLATGTTGWAWLDYLTPVSMASGGGGGGYCMTNYWGEYVCASANTANAIRYWAGQYGVGSWWLFATAACESSFNPGAYNPSSGVSGLFQFQPSTFYWQGGSSLWDVWDQSRIAAKMFATGLGSHFHCAVLQGW